MQFDYIIISAGSADNVLAIQLTEDPNTTVLLLKADGPDYRFDFRTQMPAALAYPLQGKRYNWAYETEPEPYMDHRRMEYERGKELGGSSLINGVCYIRGNAMDLDNRAKEPGLEYQSYLNCLPYCRKAETHDIGPNDYHDGDGLMSVTTPKPGSNPFSETMVTAGVRAGYPRIDDLNGCQREDFGPMDHTVTPQGRHASTAHGYLDQARGHPNLTIRTHALTDCIIFVGKRTVGIGWLKGESAIPLKATANKGVLLCAGAIVSPQVLQRSGVGNPGLLRQFDIPVVRDLPGVGENLRDHLGMYLQYECKEPVSLYPVLQWQNQPKIGAKWLFGGTGIGAGNQLEADGFIHSHAEFAWPSIQYHFLPVAINYNSSNTVREHGFQCHVGSIRSPSRSRVRLKPCDPRAHPAILFNCMSREQDRQEFRDAIYTAREIVNQPALGRYRGYGISSGAEYQSDAKLNEFMRNHAKAAFHPCGTYKMGCDEVAAVNGEDRVHGLKGVRMVDTSITPQIITGNLSATAIMVGEKMTSTTRGRQPLPRSITAYYVAGSAPVRR